MQGQLPIAHYWSQAAKHIHLGNCHWYFPLNEKIPPTQFNFITFVPLLPLFGRAGSAAPKPACLRQGLQGQSRSELLTLHYCRVVEHLSSALSWARSVQHDPTGNRTQPTSVIVAQSTNCITYSPQNLIYRSSRSISVSHNAMHILGSVFRSKNLINSINDFLRLGANPLHRIKTSANDGQHNNNILQTRWTAELMQNLQYNVNTSVCSTRLSSANKRQRRNAAEKLEKI